MKGFHGKDEIFILPIEAFGTWLPQLPVFRALVFNAGKAEHLRSAVAFRDTLEPGFIYQFHSHRVYHGLRKLCEEQHCTPIVCLSRVCLLFPTVVETITHTHPFRVFGMENETIH